MFELKEKSYLDEYKAETFLYEHKESGMEVFHVKNNSRELSCLFMFNTPSQDSKGLAHILEHTVLCGSRKFPVKDPFFQIQLSSPNTLLNAMTFCDKTIYPFSSPLKKDFDILFDIYADAVFAPLLRKESFEQEGVRSFNGKYDGVVFNEMSGCRSSEDEIVQSSMVSALYANTPWQYDSGGDPLYIADLTYEEYLARYAKWYSPSNCRLFLFGDLNATEYMEKLQQDYLYDLSRWEAKKIILDASSCNVTENPAHRSLFYCPNKDADSVVLTYLTAPSEDLKERITADLVTDILLDNPGAVLYRAITESGLGEDLNPVSGVDVDYPLIPFSFGFSGAKKDSEDEIESFLKRTIENIVSTGLPAEDVNSVLKRYAFKLKEGSCGTYPEGFNAGLRCARSWLRGKNPLDGLREYSVFEEIKKEVASGPYFEKWLEKNIICNGKYNLLTVKFSETYNCDFERVLTAKLPEKDNEEDLKAFNDFLEKQDTPEELALIPRITREDMDLAVFQSYSQEVSQDKKTVFFAQDTNGIVYSNISFDVFGLSEEEKYNLQVLLRLMQMCSLNDMDYSAVSNKIRSLTGEFLMDRTADCTVDGKPVYKVLLRFKTMKEDLNEFLVFLKHFIYDGIFSDYGRIKASVTDLLTEFDTEYLEAAYAFATIRAASSFSETAKDSDITKGTGLLLYLESIKNTCVCKEYALTLEELRKKVFSGNRVFYHFSCEEKEREGVLNSIKMFLSQFPESDFECSSPLYVNNDNACEALVVSSGPSYNSMVVPLEKSLSVKDGVSALVLASVLTGNDLWNNIRALGGAYAAECHVDLNENFFAFSSYRDPNIDKTYEAFEKALKSCPSDETVEYSVLTIAGKQLKPLSCEKKSSEAYRYFVYGITDELVKQRRAFLLNVKSQDLCLVAKMIESAMKKKKSLVTVTGKNNLKLWNKTCRITELPL